MQKTEQDTYGWQHSCINYEPCPLCYGCRHYDSSWIKCSACEQDRKKNICDIRKHTSKILSKMIRRAKINA